MRPGPQRTRKRPTKDTPLYTVVSASTGADTRCRAGHVGHRRHKPKRILRFVLNVEHIEQWRGQDVLDCDGEQIGKLEEVFYDVSSGEPVLLAVKKGFLDGDVRLVPLAGASVGHDYVRVAYGNEDIDQSEGSSLPGTLGWEETDRIAAIYGLDLAQDIELESAGVTAERRIQADEAHRRADQLASEAQRKDAEREDAQRREEGAAAEADLAKDNAEEARQAAAEARQAATASGPTSRAGE